MAWNLMEAYDEHDKIIKIENATYLNKEYVCPICNNVVIANKGVGFLHKDTTIDDEKCALSWIDIKDSKISHKHKSENFDNKKNIPIAKGNNVNVASKYTLKSKNSFLIECFRKLSNIDFTEGQKDIIKLKTVKRF